MRRELEKVLDEVEKAISGKRETVGKILLAFLARGHVLLDDVPGVGKTTLATALSRAVGLSCRRVQFTPDVMPSDLVGFSMYDRGAGGFVYRPGALCGVNIVMGDEINRASSKTQSALLEAMEEKQVTVDGTTYPLEKPFLVIATQNSAGAAGTQALPYAQMDRFLVRLSLGYPDQHAQMEMLRNRQDRDPMDDVKCVLSGDEAARMQEEASAVSSPDAVLDYITRLTIASREHDKVAVGVSPRGALFLDRAAKARAWADERDYTVGADVRDVFRDVCAHRILLKEGSGETAEGVLEDLLRTTQSPDRRCFPGRWKA